ncbi:hypothetical protein QM012_001347 [Aureobasidium pullulans]|uniref:Dehydrogenase (DH) domain-containing protein n=1 Tax=Aureobasidium pullulans TaxID=5580 RepID=A0ABR0TDS6_AURPU
MGQAHPRLRLDEPAARFRCPSLHHFRDHIGQDAVSMWPFDPAYATQQDSLCEDASIRFNGPDGCTQLQPIFALQVYTLGQLSDDLSEFLSTMRDPGLRSFKSWEWELRNTRLPWRIDVYQTPMHDVHACIAHHKQEIAHRSTVTQSGFGGGTIHLYGKHANRARIIVLDPPDWSQKPIVLADFAARDKLPKSCPYELDMGVHAVDNVDNTHTMHQAIQEWCLDAEREPWRLEASEEYSNSKPPSEPRIVRVLKSDEASPQGSVESQNNGRVCVKLRKDEAASVEVTSRHHVFHLESAALDSAQLGQLLLESITPFLPPGTSIDLLIHPPEPHINSCLAAFHNLRLSEGRTTRSLTFTVIDKHDLVEDSGILFVQVDPAENQGAHVKLGPDAPLTDVLPLYQQWNNRHAMIAWRAYDIKHAAREFVKPRLNATVQGSSYYAQLVGAATLDRSGNHENFNTSFLHSVLIKARTGRLRTAR